MSAKVFSYDGHETNAVMDVNLKLDPGELVLLLGPSGSGKTTLLTLMAGLLAPTSGTIKLFGQNITELSTRSLQELRAKSIGFVFQMFRLIDSLTALENVALVLHFAGVKRRPALSRGREMLDQFDVGHLADKLPGEMSHGEKQRVAIARALANDARLIVADEPTANLESQRMFEIVGVLQSITGRDDRCVVIASHDERIAEFADRVIKIKDGKLI
jgi:putative ABC transport system ATP-binding protein